MSCLNNYLQAVDDHIFLRLFTHINITIWAYFSRHGLSKESAVLSLYFLTELFYHDIGFSQVSLNLLILSSNSSFTICVWSSTYFACACR